MPAYYLTKNGKALYLQLAEALERDIRTGRIPAHTRLPSKRRMAERVQPELLYLLRGGSQEAQE